MADQQTSRRLDPFSFPPETNVRFVLLILAICMLAVSMSQPLNIVAKVALWLAQGGSLDNYGAAENLAPAGDAGAPGSLAAMALEGVGEELLSLVFPAAGIAVVLLAAAWLYRNHPNRLRRRKKLTLLAPDQQRGLQRQVEQAARQIGIDPPAIMLGKGARSKFGQAFGTGQRYLLALGGGMRILLLKMPAHFRALLLHELAHIYNRDIGPAYFSDALWRASIYLIALPFAVIVLGLALLSALVTLFTGSLTELVVLVVLDIIGVVVIALILGVPFTIIFVIRAGLLRVREFYADWRAAQWGAEAALLDILETNAAQEKRKIGLHFHPAARDRLKVLRDPAGLFRLALDMPFIVGTLLAFVINGLHTYIFAISAILLSLFMAAAGGTVEAALDGGSILELLVAGITWSSVGLTNVALFVLLIFGVSYLVVGSVGLQIQRETVVQMLEGYDLGKQLLRLGAVAAVITAGVEIGFLVAPPYALSPLGALIGGLVSPFVLLLIFPWLLIFFLFTFVGLVYVRFSAQIVLGWHGGAVPPRRKLRLLIVVQSLAFTALYYPLLVARTSILYPVDEIMIGAFLSSIVIGPLVFAIICGATGLYLFWQRRAGAFTCSACSAPIHQPYLIGHVCADCGQSLASWPFVQSAVKTVATTPGPAGRLAPAD